MMDDVPLSPLEIKENSLTTLSFNVQSQEIQF